MTTASHSPTMDVLLFGPFALDRAAYSLIKAEPEGTGHRVALRPKTFDVLRYLVERPGRIIPQEEFLAALWPETFVQPEVLKGHILAVRTALEDRAQPPQYVETVRNRGYRFIADVRTPSALGRAEVADNVGPAILVGRAAAMGELELARRRARAGDMQLAFIAGEAGIGKTALAESFAGSATSQDATVVIGRCLSGSGETDAYYPILEILTALCRGSMRDHLAATLAEFAPTWLVQLPALATAYAPGLRGDVVGATPHRMARELCDALEAFTHSRFLLLILEDIHWADPATLDLIQLLANRRPRARLMILATLRAPGPGEAGHTAAALVQTLSLYRLAREIRLQPLELGEVEAFLDRLVHAAPPPIQLTRHLHRRSEGNPLFMRAILDFLLQRNLVTCGEEGWRLDEHFEFASQHAPPDLVQIIEADIQALPAQAQSVLEAASLSDGPFSPSIHHVASGLGEEAFETVCETLTRRGQLVRRGDVADMPDGGRAQTYVFRHALFQEVAHDRQGSARRAVRHAAIADRLADLFNEDLSPAASHLARHFIQAGRWPQAIRFLSMAARTAMRRFARREAAALLEQAIGLSRKLPVQERGASELGLLDEQSRIYLGAFDDRAAGVYERLSRLAREMGRVDVEARALFGLGYVVSWVDRDRCLDILGDVLAKSADIADAVERARARCSAHGWRNWVQGWNPIDAAGLQAAIEELRTLGAPLALAAGDVDHSLVLFPAARYAEAIEAVRRGFAVLVDNVFEPQVDLSLPVWMLQLGIPWALMSSGQFGEAVEGFVSGCAACEANGEIGRSATLRLYHAFVHERMHDHETALTMLDETVGLIRDNGLEFSPNEIKIELVVRGLAELGLGQIEEAFTHLLAARAEMDARNTLTSWYWRLAGEWGLADAYLLAGDLDAAEVCANGFLERACAIEERSWRGLAAESCARIAVARGDLPGARAYLVRAWSQIEGYQAALVRWRLHAVEARIAILAGDAMGVKGHGAAQAAELETLAATLPDGHPGRRLVLDAQPFMPGVLASRTSHLRRAPPSG